jgi:hypothetical protein
MSDMVQLFLFKLKSMEERRKSIRRAQDCGAADA